MTTDDKVLAVRLNGEPIGLLEQTLSGKMCFTYNPDAVRPLSIGMPVQAKAYDEIQTEAYFWGGCYLKANWRGKPSASVTWLISITVFLS